jgi:phage-related protein
MKKQMIGMVGLVFALAAIAGCGSGSAGSSTSGASTNAKGAATATAAEATAIVSSMTATQVTTSGGAFSNAADTDSSGCPTVDVKSTGNNGQWTDEVLTYAAPPCEFTGPRGYATLAITGTLELTRSNGAAYSFQSNTNNLEFAFSTGGTTYSETRNGTRNITANSNGASATNNITVDYVGAFQDGTLVDQMAATFTPVSGATLVAGEPLPSGTLNVNGAVQWSGTNSGGSYTVTTVTPLAYDATCKDTEPSPFDSGEIQLRLMSQSGDAYAQVTWTNCGKPAVVFISN